MILVGIIHGLAFWILDPLISTLLTRNQNLIDSMFSPEPHEIWVRSFVLFMFILFGGFAGSIMTHENAARKALQESERLFRLLYDDAPLGYLSLDSKGNIVKANRAWLELMGYEEKEVVGRSLGEFLSSASASYLVQKLPIIIAHGEAHRVEFDATKKDGSPVTLSIDCKVTQSGHKLFSQIHCIINDITEQKHAETALRESQTKLRGILTAAPIGIGRVINRKFDWVSDYMLNLVGYSREELIGQNSRVLYVSEEEYKQVGKQIDKIVSARIPGEIETSWRRKDGTTLEIHLCGTLLDPDNPSEGLIFTASDITERKQTGRSLERINECFLNFRTRPEENIQRLTALCGELLEADCALYNRLENGLLCSLGQWNTPPDYIPKDSPNGHICYDIINRHDEEIAIIRDLFDTRYAVTDPNVSRYNLKTYVGKAVKCGKDYLGSLCVVYQRDIEPSAGELRIISILAAAIGIEEERMRAESALLEREHFLRAVFDGIQDGISVLDKDLNILRVNSTMERWYNHRAPLIGKKCFEAYHGRQCQCEICPTVRALETLNSQVDIVPLTGPKGIEGWLELFAFPLFDNSNNCIGVIEYVRDITARTLAQEELAKEKERLAVTLRSIGDGVITTDTQGKIILFNKAAEELTGWTQSEAAGSPIQKAFHIVDEASRQSLPDLTSTVIAGGETLSIIDKTILIAKDESERMVSYSVAPIKDENGRTIGVVLVFRDVTEKRRMEQDLARTEKLESLGILAGGIAHDFNNILTAIMGNISLVKINLDENNELCKRLTEAERASMRAQELTQQLLTFSKGGAPVRRTASINDIVRDTAEFALRGSNVKCKFDLPNDLLPAEIDEGQISQVINNLIINADQAMPQGGTIEISAENMPVSSDDLLPVKCGNYIKITVSDQGIGIPESYIGKIFDPFFTTKQKGSGLGLATTYSIIKQHEGHIEVESEVGVGTTFHIYLPASEKKLSTQRKSEEAAIPGSGRVLIMDDDETIRMVASIALSNLGYGVERARDGNKAIELYRQAMESGRPFDAVIIDLTIPGGLGGKETISRLTQIDPEVKAIVSSGYSNDPIMAEYWKYGFKGFVPKPYKVQQLSKALHDLLSGDNKEISADNCGVQTQSSFPVNDGTAR
jgi:PAS domain S-box-containing protein